ncbi:MAG: rhomboid family intramembrane serine protease [Candidatus Melainabacteria bacterium]|nr:rhomboid family intramembrane serine protease [Candidatus Melainabacteria bacterium]
MPQNDYVTYDPRIPKHKSYLTNFLISIIFSVYIIEIVFNAFYSDKAIIMLGAKWNEGITNGEYWRFLTCTFLHGNLIHLFLNITAIYIFGKEVESIYGLPRFFLIYFLSSWGAGLASYIFSPGISIGASGALFGIIGALIIFFFRQREKVTGANLKFKSMYTLVILNLLLGFLLPKIDNAGHLGGLVTGLFSSWFIAPEYKIEKDEKLQKILVSKKPDFYRLSSGILLTTTILFWLTKISIDLASSIK